MLAYLKQRIFAIIASLSLAPIVAFYSPIQSLVLPIFWLVLIDVITGAYVSRFIEHQDLTSRRFGRKALPLTLFTVGLTALLHANPFFVEFGMQQFQAAKYAISFYGLYELFSILENLGKCGMPGAKQISAFLKAKLPDDAKAALTEIEPK